MYIIIYICVCVYLGSSGLTNNRRGRAGSAAMPHALELDLLTAGYQISGTGALPISVGDELHQ